MSERTGVCRFCGAPLSVTFVDLGMSPLSNAYVSPERAKAMEPFYPLHAYVCGECLLAQLEEFFSSLLGRRDERFVQELADVVDYLERFTRGTR